MQISNGRWPWLSQLRVSLYHHRILGLLLAVYAVAVVSISLLPAVEHPIYFKLYSRHARLAFGLMTTVLLARRIWWLAAIEKEQRPLKRFFLDAKEWLISGKQLVPLALVVVVMPVFLSAFTSFKTMIPTLNPFCWDADLSQLDRALHGGYLPSDLTRYVFGNVWATFAINFFYNIWYPVLYAVLFWQAFQARDAFLRMRFLFTYLMCWIVIGSVTAVILSSGGPCFYGRLCDAADPYASHMNWLGETHATLQPQGFGLGALGTQEMLWQFYSATDTKLGSGISAMPSMHVAMAALMALTAWKYGGWRRWLFVFYLVVTQVGSVHLGWHYAVDGYLAATMTVVLWQISIPLARWSLCPIPERLELAALGWRSLPARQAFEATGP